MISSSTKIDIEFLRKFSERLTSHKSKVSPETRLRNLKCVIKRSYQKICLGFDGDEKPEPKRRPVWGSLLTTTESREIEIDWGWVRDGTIISL